MPKTINEDYRRAALLLATAADDDRYHSVIICSSTKGEGTTTAVLNIARELTENHKFRTLVLELNWRRPVYARMFDLDNDKSVAAVAAGRHCPRQCIQRDGSGLALLPSGEDVPGSGGTAGVAAVLRSILQDVESEFDFVLLDMPPVLETTDVIGAGLVVPRVIMVVEAGRTRYEMLDRVRRELRAESISIVGTVLTKQKRFIPGWAYKWLVR